MLEAILRKKTPEWVEEDYRGEEYTPYRKPDKFFDWGNDDGWKPSDCAYVRFDEAQRKLPPSMRGPCMLVCYCSRCSKKVTM